MNTAALALQRPLFHGVTVHSRPGLEAWLSRAGLDVAAPDWHACQLGETVAFDGRVAVQRLAIEPGHPPLYLKIYNHRNETRRFFCRRSKAYQEVTGMVELQRIGIPTLDVIAWGERRRFGCLIEAFIITVDATCSGSLRDVVNEEFPHYPPEQKTARIEALAAILLPQLRQVHDAGFFHRDLKWRNLLLKRDQEGREDLIWMDCPRRRFGWFGGIRSDHNRLVDLSSLAQLSLQHLSRTQRWRFLRQYLGDGHEARSKAKLWFRLIAARLVTQGPPRGSVER